MKKAVLVYLSLLIVVIGISCYLIDHDIKAVNKIPEPVEPVENDKYLIDLNTADANEFERIPGIGYTLANNIVQYREENGPFQEYGELLNVKGIGPEKLLVMMDYVRIK